MPVPRTRTLHHAFGTWFSRKKSSSPAISWSSASSKSGSESRRSFEKTGEALTGRIEHSICYTVLVAAGAVLLSRTDSRESILHDSGLHDSGEGESRASLLVASKRHGDRLCSGNGALAFRRDSRVRLSGRDRGHSEGDSKPHPGGKRERRNRCG